MHNILSSLQSLPIFRLSLGSKELFHSNFMEFLWDTDRSMFVRIINRLLPAAQALPAGVDYSNHELSREKANFDICIYHTDYHYTKNGKATEHLVYDLIIENKVKSISLKQQLDEYVIKVSKNKWNSSCPPRYLLLSLVDSFADKVDIQNEGIWEIANYSQLKTAIEDEQSSWSGVVGSSYITDYCSFIGFMHQLQKAILHNLGQTRLFQDVDEFKSCRLHDLYIKLRCCEFLMLLKEKLVQLGMKTSNVSFIKEYSDIRVNHVPHVYLNYNIFKGVGQAAAWIYTDKTENGDIHEVVIQGNQYRHGINKKTDIKSKDEDEKIESQKHIWDELHKNSFDANFLETLTMPDTPKKGRQAPFNGYGPDYVYRYDVVTTETVDQLLNRMAKDVIDVYNH